MADIVITTAQISGKEASKIITGETVKKMKSANEVGVGNSKFAAESGRNCTLTKIEDRIITDNAVNIIGFTN